MKKAVKKEKKKMSKQEKEIIIFLIVVGAIIASVIGGYYFFQSLKTFDYAGVKWTEEVVQSVDKNTIYYYGHFPIYYRGIFYANYNMYLRNDPRENEVPVGENFSIGISKDVVITLDKAFSECNGANVVNTNIAMFVGSFPWVRENGNISGALSDVELAEKMNAPFADCSNATDDKTIISVRLGDESYVEQQGNCYVLTMGSCEDNYLVSEKFLLEIISQLNANIE